ncbi:hypothetical protein N6H18_15375 [Reichenbachiella agarivorans]|uniref:DUF2490 domain-containing protein n=1 Tax=Reichenbachiella agarivorans TaxID=2979464 RepID=A0ABY6CMW7_9BACT|nr:hypothetical protein [Reichenbachiella agarivorans]UXP31729.1 hypothetical protein N6H18_15375 [Reichenbachiella agarivorans]
MNIQSIACYVIMTLMPLVRCYSQDTDSLDRSTKRSLYLDLGLGLGKFNYTDFGTSPLTFRGSSYAVSVNGLILDDSREIHFGLDYISGAASNVVRNEVAVSQMYSIGIHYTHMYRIKALSSEKWNTKLGGQINVLGELRYAPAMQNADIGLDVFANILASVKVTRDLSRITPKEKKIWFIRYKLDPRKKNLSYQMNVGVINHNLRNGYAYLGQSSVVNDFQLFDDYQFHTLSGFRMSSQLDYSYFLKNNNALRLSYLWDAFNTGGDLNQFQMAYHTIKLALLFNMK